MIRQSLTGLTLQELQAVTVQMNLPKFTAKQMANWIYQKQIFDIQEMTNLSQKARDLLSEHYSLGRSKPAKTVVSNDGTEKYLFPTQGGNFVETVFIPAEDRGTLCVSSQVGCKMGCRFCMTGRQGFQEHLSVSDILNQIYSFPHFDRLTNIVFMGQGEPFDNTDNVLLATSMLTMDYSLAWSPKRITVSTVGLTKGLKRFLDESECHLAVSLHFPQADLREQWMPIQKAHPVDDVLKMLHNYDFSHQRRLSFEYLMLHDINSSLAHAQQLLILLKGLDCRVNLIPYHTIPNSPLQGCTEEEMKQFRDYLTHHGLMTTLRASRGQDIEAACGLLSTAENNKK